MNIHRALPSESIMSIAEKYRILPNKILSDNGILGERLASGEELLILTPTRSAPVRGGDTLGKFASRYGVRKNSILTANPSLMGKDSLRPGQMLTVKYSKPPLGTSSAIGKFSGGNTEKFKAALPYLTYLVLSEYSLCRTGVKRTKNLTELHDYSRGRSKIALLGFECKEDFILSKDDLSYELSVNEIMNLAKVGEYQGVYIVLPEMELHLSEAYKKFILLLRRAFIGENLLLFAESSEVSCGEIAPLCDAAVLSESKTKALNKKEACERAEAFAIGCEGSGAFLSLDCFGNSNDGIYKISDIREFAIRSGKEIEHENEHLTAYLTYNKFSHGKRRENTIYFPSLSRIEEDMRFAASLGFMGFCFDIENAPISYFCMFNWLFSRADYMIFDSSE